MVIRSRDEERLVKHLVKKSGKKRVNVYFNKKSSSGKTKYINGKYFSKKNNDYFTYRSSYELAYFIKLEEDKTVLQYSYEPFETEYLDSFGVKRNYIPDLMILFEDGKILIAEIKPKAMLVDFDVRAKAASARKLIASQYKDYDMTYKFITENDIFSSTQEYNEFVKKVKSGEIG